MASIEELLRQASALREAGRFAEAEAAYKRVLAAEPNLPSSWYNLAWLQRQLGRYESALVSYQHALERGASEPEEIHLNRGVIYADHLRDDDAAERELRAALARNPRYLPALLNLGNLSEDRGKRDEALDFYQRALAEDPACFDALARFVALKGVASADDPLVGRLEQAIAGGATAAEKANLGFALGKVLDACGEYDEAFVAYEDANKASRASAGGGALYDRASHEAVIDALIETFPLDATRVPAPVGPSPTLFICGMFRSGSTLAEQVLSGHPRVTMGGEIAYLPNAVATQLAPFPRSLRTVEPSTLARIANGYRETIAKVFPGADIVTDKRPDNFLYIGLIKTLFPDAKVVHTVRDPLDNALSVFFLHLDPRMSYALDLDDIAHYYTQYRRLMAHWEKLYGGDILRFDYDTFVREPEAELRGLLEFAGLEWDESLLAFHKHESTVKTASVWQVREPLYQRASGRWRNYERHLARLREYLASH